MDADSAARPPPPDALASHAGFVRRLAFALLKNDADADDAAQETLARAWERPARRPPGGRPWLATLLRNVVRRRKRDEQRTARRESVAARPDRAAAADDVAARHDILRRVVDAISHLDAPSREVVLLRHYEDLPPRAIAERLGVPVETVKKRLVRAHERLRLLLDEGRGGNVEGWRSALGALIGVEQPKGGPPAGISSPSATAGSAITGGVVMGTAAKAAIGVAAILVVGVATWVVWDHSKDRERSDASFGSTAVGAADEKPVAPPLLAGHPQPPGARDASDKSGQSAAEAAPTAVATEPTLEQVQALMEPTSIEVIRGVVLGARGPVAGATVTARIAMVSAQRTTLIMEKYGSLARLANKMSGARSDDRGEFEIADMLADLYEVSVEVVGATRRAYRVNEGFVPSPDGSRSFKPARRRLVVVLGDGIVEGTFFDRAGAPAAGKTIRLTRVWSRGSKPMTLEQTRLPMPASETLDVTTNADGGFRFTRLPSGTWDMFGLFEGTQPVKGADVRQFRFELKPGETKRVDLGSAVAEPLWTGTLRSATGTPFRAPTLLFLSDVEHGVQIWAKIGKDGRISQRLPTGTYGVSLAGEAGNALPGTLPSLVVGAEDLEKDLVIPGARVAGTVMAFAIVKGEERRVRGSWAVKATRVPATGAPGVDVLTNLDGVFEFPGLPVGRWRLEATAVLEPLVPVSSAQEIDVTDRDIDGLVFELRPR